MMEKFLMTISTTPRVNANENDSKRNVEENEFVFGQSTINEHDSNTLTSLTKKRFTHSTRLTNF